MATDYVKRVDYDGDGNFESFVVQATGGNDTFSVTANRSSTPLAKYFWDVKASFSDGSSTQAMNASGVRVFGYGGDDTIDIKVRR